jgi:hypothetical protein
MEESEIQEEIPKIKANFSEQLKKIGYFKIFFAIIIGLFVIVILLIVLKVVVDKFGFFKTLDPDPSTTKKKKATKEKTKAKSHAPPQIGGSNKVETTTSDDIAINMEILNNDDKDLIFEKYRNQDISIINVKTSETESEHTEHPQATQSIPVVMTFIIPEQKQEQSESSEVRVEEIEG